MLRWLGIIAASGIILLLVNAILVARDTSDAEPFAGGHVLELDGPDLNVREYGPPGADTAIVLLHGFAGSIEWWEAAASDLARATDRRVITIDLVGHGGSESPGNDDSFSAEGQSTAIAEALAGLGLSRAVVVGHSMGGHIATALAEREPSLIESVAVIDTFGDAGLREQSSLAEVGCWPIVGHAIDRFRRIDAMVEDSLQAGFANDFAVPPLAFRSLERLTHRGVCESHPGVTMNEERPVADRLAALDVPVLVVWGDQDVLTPTAPNVARYKEAGLRPVVIPGAGHSPMVEKPTALVRVLTPFTTAEEP
jgi:pimeloyl-ACP methyl ester carboxylesterase